MLVVCLYARAWVIGQTGACVYLYFGVPVDYLCLYVCLLVRLFVRLRVFASVLVYVGVLLCVCVSFICSRQRRQYQ